MLQKIRDLNYSAEDKQLMADVVNEALRKGKSGGDGAQLMGETLSPAMERLNRLEAAYTPLPSVKHVVLTGEDWFVLRGNSEHITKAGLWSARDASGSINLLADGSFTRLQAALFFVFCVASENDLRPHFQTFAEAHRQASSTHPALVGMNARLFAAIVEVNPDVIPKPDAEQVQPEGDGDFLDQPPSTSKPPNGEPNTG